MGQFGGGAGKTILVIVSGTSYLQRIIHIRLDLMSIVFLIQMQSYHLILRKDITLLIFDCISVLISINFHLSLYQS